MSQVLDQLKLSRQGLGITQSELAKKLGLPQGHISRIENHLTDPRLSTISDLARFLDLEIMLIPRQMVPVINSLLKGEDESAPLWKLDDDEST